MSISTDGTTVYTVSAAGDIYSSPVTSAAAITIDPGNAFLGGTDAPCTDSSTVVCTGSIYTEADSIAQPGYAGPFSVATSDASVVTATTSNNSPGSNGLVFAAHKAGKALLTIVGSGGGDKTFPVVVTTLNLNLHLNPVVAAKTYTVTFSGDWGMGTQEAVRAYPTDGDDGELAEHVRHLVR